MDKNLQECLDKLSASVSFTRMPVKRIRWARDYYQVHPTDEREWMKEVAEIELVGGSRIYADIGADSNLAALYDITAVLIGKKQKSSYIQRIEFPEEGDTTK